MTAYSDVNNILILIPNWLGDVVMCTPALRTIHHRYPSARITVAGRAGACNLVSDLLYVDRVVSIPARPGILGMIRLRYQLRADKFDLAVVFPHSFRAALLARAIGAKRILGYERGNRGWLLTDKVEPNRKDGQIAPVYMTWEYLDLLLPLKCEYDGFGLELNCNDISVARVREHIVGEGPFVGFAPGAAFGPSKQWPVERFAAVADALSAEIGARCILLTGPGEETTRDAFIKLCTCDVLVCDEGNPTIDSLKATISILDILVCNDSGPRHVAVAFNVPTICVMGSTRPAYSEGPYELGEVLRIDVDCGPCQKPICTTDHRCMTGIPPERVTAAVRRYLQHV